MSRLTFRVLPGSVKTIGRATGTDFIVDALVSRVHCRLTSAADGTLAVEDLDSTNGTFVNDRPVRRGGLAPGDRLRVGRRELVLQQETRESASSHRAPEA